MAIERPYYAKHQVLTGQYTSGNQYITKDGLDYVGAYHVLPNGKYFTGFSPTDTSHQIFEKRFDQTEDVRVYNKINNVINSKYIQPIPYLVRPTLNDYQDGYVLRYFVQKRNNPLVTITEIDSSQYFAINNKNQPGLNEAIWKSVVLKWKINGSYIEQFNQREIDDAFAKGFIGLKGYLKNLFEFMK